MLRTAILRGFPGGASGKELAHNAGATGDSSTVPGLRRFPGGGHGNPLQYSCLENPMDREVWGYGPEHCKELETRSDSRSARA